MKENKYKNRVFCCKKNNEIIKLILDPVGVILSPLYAVDWSNCVEEKEILKNEKRI